MLQRMPRRKDPEMIEKRCLVLLLCIVLLSIGCKKPEETIYQGKPLSAWINMLENPNPVTRYTAIKAIGEIGPKAKQAIPQLVETIRETRNRDKRMLLACNHALLEMGREIVPSMIFLLKDDEWEMRRGAAWILGKVGPDAKDAIPALTRALKDTNAAVRNKAAESLKKIRGEENKSEKPVSGDPASRGKPSGAES